MLLFYKDELKGAVEALLFVASEPLTIARLAQLVEKDEETIAALVEEMQQEFSQKHRGVRIEKVAGGYRMMTRADYLPVIERLYRPQVTPLSQAALETLAIIAYKQPVTKAEIESIRGVNADSVVHTLVERRLIEEVGRMEAPGRPILYAVTGRFLEYLGLDALSELPEVEGLST